MDASTTARVDVDNQTCKTNGHAKSGHEQWTEVVLCHAFQAAGDSATATQLHNIRTLSGAKICTQSVLRQVQICCACTAQGSRFYPCSAACLCAVSNEMTTSPKARGEWGIRSSQSAAGKDKTSVADAFPRHSSLSSVMYVSSHKTTESSMEPAGHTMS